MRDVPYNALTVLIYVGLSTTLRPDPGQELALATRIRKSTVFPNGLYGPAEFFIPRADPTRRWSWRPGDRVVIKNGFEIVYEGKLTGADWFIGENETGLIMKVAGQWGDNLGRQVIDKRFADNRLSEWRPAPDDQFTAFSYHRRDDSMTAVTKDIVYRNGDLAPIGRYWSPTGQAAERMTFDYEFVQEGVWVPDAAKHNDAPGGLSTFTDLENALDDDDTTYSAVTITSDDFLYIGTTEERFEAFFLFVNMGAVVNSSVATLTCEYSQGGGVWAAQAITDGTAVSGRTFAQDGFITIQPNKDWERERVDSKTARWFRFKTSANLTANIRFIRFEFLQNQSFKLALYNNTTAADEWSVTSSASGSADVTFGTADQNPGLYMQSTANQRGFGNGSVYGSISNIVVYSEIGPITVSSTAIHIHGLATYLNSDVTRIATNSLSVVPFISRGYESLASMLERLTAYGDASFNSWHAKLLHSEWAAAPDGKPVLALEQHPVLTDHDYVISIDEENVQGDIEVVLDSSQQANWIVVAYRDKETGVQHFVTPDDDANLMDSTSITQYGERHVVIDAGEATLATAVNFGRRYLAKYKNPRFYVASPITVVEYIRADNGQEVPAANIEAGKRLKIENFLHDLWQDTNVRGFVDIITEAAYTDGGENSPSICRLSLGIQDDASLLLAQAIAATTPPVIGGPGPPVVIG